MSMEFKETISALAENRAMRVESYGNGLHELTIDDALAALESKGYTTQFRAHTTGAIHCSTCNKDWPAEELMVHVLERIEGSSDPDDESIVMAGECPCGAQGTEVFHFGSGGEPGEVAALLALQDAR